MVIDSSALVAILRKEDEAGAFIDAILRASTRLLGAPTAVETSIVILSLFGDQGLTDLEALSAEMRLEVVPLTAGHVTLAVDAFRRFGKGRHRAGLNFGDCFCYALAKATGEPLIFKGDDFAHTDVRRVQ